uniref:DNA polymerase epsilon subunit 2 n=1 Tax=Zeugodacus cucurbitae TaxID=28588 RepID=A0A0A1WCK3_ZEUCU
MKYWNKIIALSILGFPLCFALNLKDLSFEILSDKVARHLQGVQQVRIIQPESMNPELMKVSSVKSLDNKWPKKLNEVKLPFVEMKQNQSKIQMQKQLVSDSNKSSVLLLITRLQYVPILMASTSLPREILASVRKNEKLLNQQKQRITHRHKKFTTHTVVLKVANKQDKFRQGNNHKSLSQKWRRNRVRRELKNASNSKVEEEIKKQQFSSDLVDNAQLIIQKGKLLLWHLDELFKDANFYLPKEGEVINRFSTNSSMNRVRNRKLVTKRLAPQKYPEYKINDTIDSTILILKTHEENKIKRDSYILKHTCSKQPDRKAAEILLYKDVIANIRNMQHTQNIYPIKGERAEKKITKQHIILK